MMKIDMNQIYLNQINDMENVVFASELLLNCSKLPIFEPLRPQNIIKTLPKVVMIRFNTYYTLKHQLYL